jgi:hypothetical protein
LEQQPSFPSLALQSFWQEQLLQLQGLQLVQLPQEQDPQQGPQQLPLLPLQLGQQQLPQLPLQQGQLFFLLEPSFLS